MEQNWLLLLILHLWVSFIYSVATREVINQAPFPDNGKKQEFVGLNSATVSAEACLKNDILSPLTIK